MSGAVNTVQPQFDGYKPIDLIDPSPFNPRKRFDQAKLQELAESIKAMGIIEPIVVRPVKAGRVEIVAGERRYRGAKIAGLAEVPVITRYLTDVQVHEMMAVENDQREGVHPLERAVGFDNWMRADPSVSAEVIAERIGKSKRTVQLCLQYLTLTPEAQQAFRDERITAGHADLLVRLKSDEQRRALAACFEELSLISLPEAQRDRIDEAKDFLDGLPETKKGKKPKPVAVEIPHRLRSVRELSDWIDTHVRADRADLQSTLPELDEAVIEAETEGRKVIEISHLTRNDVNTGEYRYDNKTLGAAVDDADTKADRQKALRRVVFSPNWKLADGSKKTTPADNGYGPMKNSPTCEHSVLGVVTFGYDKGKTFTVCVAKKTCRVHWPAPEKRSGGGSYNYNSEEAIEKRRQEQATKERQEAVYAQVFPAVVAAIAAKLPAKLDRKAFGFIWNGKQAPKVPETQFVAALVKDKLARLDDSWGRQQLYQAAGYWGVDAKKIESTVAAEFKAAEMKAAGATVVKAAAQTSAKKSAKKKPAKKPAKKVRAVGKGKK